MFIHILFFKFLSFFLSLFVFPNCGAWFARVLFSVVRCTFIPFFSCDPQVKTWGYSYLALSGLFLFPLLSYISFFFSLVSFHLLSFFLCLCLRLCLFYFLSFHSRPPDRTGRHSRITVFPHSRIKNISPSGSFAQRNRYRIPG